MYAHIIPHQHSPLGNPELLDWPLCATARRMSTAILRSDGGGDPGLLQWTRLVETFRPDDGPSLSDVNLKLW